MPYQQELSFLRDVFLKNHVNVHLISIKEMQTEMIEKEIWDEHAVFSRLLPTLLPETLYKFTDPFHRCYRLLLLPERETASETALCIGPFLTEKIPPQQLLEISKEHSISHSYRYLLEYYTGLSVVQDNSPLSIMLNTFCERMWNTPSFLVKDVTDTLATDTPFSKSMLNLEPNDALVNKKAIEQRYAFENELIRAVALGQAHMEERFQGAFSENFFEKRTADPLRNAKNYGIIMNTLLRKAAESGGVHPVYLNQTSSEFAEKIEKLSHLSTIPLLMKEMFRTYCRLVRKHSLRKYSLVVQKSILIIDADLSADLSPKLIAKSQGVTLGYLSTVFRKETGKTLSEYIRERRIEYAKYLLHTTDLQIQTISLHCGIMDAQYFSKLFKKITGKTPLQYRRSSSKK